MGKSQRRKGTDEERAIVHALRALDGWDAKRVPMSGAADGFPGDVIATAPNGDKFRIESKRRGHGFKQIEKWLGDNDLLWIRADFRDGMWVVPARIMVELLKRYGKDEANG